MLPVIYTVIKITRLSVVSVTVAAALAGWPVAVGVDEVGVVSKPGTDAERYRCACLHCTQGLAGRGDAYQCDLDWGLSTTPPQPFYGPLSGTTRVSRSQERSSEFYGARED